MSETPSPGEPETPVPVIWRLALWSMVVGLCAFLVLLLWRGFAPASWEFSVQSSTQVAEVYLRPNTQTKWQIDGAYVCARNMLDLPDQYRVEGKSTPCGSRAWRAWRIDDPEVAIYLNGNVSSIMQIRPEGGFAISLSAGDDADLGTISITGVAEDVRLGSKLNLIWRDIPAQALTLPFSGETILGRAVSWSNTRMLIDGVVTVFSPDESADERTQVDSADLMLGDQVSLRAPGEGQPWSKGFVRIESGAQLMSVVAFGRADSLRIERYGESGYDFVPGWFNKLASDPSIAFWGSLLIAYITLILSLQPLVEAGHVRLAKFNLWRRLSLRFGSRSEL